MIPLRGGRYSMGDSIGNGQPYERPVHEVAIGPFWIGRFEVTNAEWKTCVAAGRCVPALVNSDDAHGRYPVAGVSWSQAGDYVSWLSSRTGKPYRLPSEAEWEYAARAGEQRSYTWGSSTIAPCGNLNLADASGRRDHPNWSWAETCDDHYAGAAPVGSFPPNAWGLHDMLGNVWEWVSDCWHADYTGAPADGTSWESDSCRKRVNRGGGWGNNLPAMRLSSRDADPADTRSDGLGFRVARSMSAAELAAELAAGKTAMPDNRPAPVEAAPVAKTARGKAAAASIPETVPLPQAVTSLALERQFDVHLSVNGNQAWNNVLQHTDGTTRQDYLLSTHLRSDGVLYGDNLLDPDPGIRLRVKQQYLARQGLIRIKAQYGGTLPRTAEEISALTSKIQAGNTHCAVDAPCIGEAAELTAALDALQNNTAADLEALIAAPATGLAARWLYFFGYPGCPVRIHVTSETHIAGQRAYDRAKKHLEPWSLDRAAVSDGGAEDRTGLCRRYVATVDILSGDVYLENLYLPSPPGSTVRSRNGSVERLQENLPIPPEVLTWTTSRLRHTRETGTYSETLPANAPLDGDYTVLGHFEGQLQTSLQWSFNPVEGAQIAKRPPP